MSSEPLNLKQQIDGSLIIIALIMAVFIAVLTIVVTLNVKAQITAISEQIAALAEPELPPGEELLP